MIHVPSSAPAAPLRALLARLTWHALACTAFALAAGCGARPGPPDAAAPAAPRFAAAAKGYIDIEGGVVRLAARRDGVIGRVLVEEGSRVQAGQLLAELDNALPEHELALARSEAEQARRQSEPARVKLAAARRERLRLEPLAPDDLVARRDLDLARDEEAAAQAELSASLASVETALQRVALAQRRVEEGVVRAPADGEIIRRQARPGNGVSTLNVTPLFVFAPDAPRIVRAELEDRFLPVVRPGQHAEVVLESDDRRRHAARVLRIGRMAGQRTPSDDPAERQDSRVVECVLALESGELLIGQRVVVRFFEAGVPASAPDAPAAAHAGGEGLQ